MQHVKCGAKISDCGPAFGGIPQGSALGLFPFLVYVNNIPLQVTVDTTVYCNVLMIGTPLFDDVLAFPVVCLAFLLI